MYVSNLQRNPHVLAVADQVGSYLLPEICLGVLGRTSATLIPHDAEPVGHISPYPRIDLSLVRTERTAPQAPSATEQVKRLAEAERIWRLIVQAAEGS